MQHCWPISSVCILSVYLLVVSCLSVFVGAFHVMMRDLFTVYVGLDLFRQSDELDGDFFQIYLVLKSVFG